VSADQLAGEKMKAELRQQQQPWWWWWCSERLWNCFYLRSNIL